MKLMVVSDGQGTRVVDMATGEQVAGVAAVRWEHTDPDGPAVLHLDLIDVDAVFEAEVPGPAAGVIAELSTRYRTHIRAVPP
jgi:hypothetical protein